MALVNSHFITARAEQLRQKLSQQISSLHADVTEQPKFSSLATISVCGILVDRYKDDQGKTEAKICVVFPTVCYTKTEDIRDRDKSEVAYVDVESKTLTVFARESSMFAERIQQFKNTGWFVEFPDEALSDGEHVRQKLVIKPLTTLKLSFKINIDDVPLNSIVTASFSMSAWVPACPGPPQPILDGAGRPVLDPSGQPRLDRVIRPRAFTNGQSLTIAHEAIQEKLIRFFAAYPQLCSTHLMRMDDLLAAEGYDPEKMRVKSDTVFFLPVGASVKESFTTPFMFSNEAGGGCLALMKVDTRDTSPLLYMPKDENDETKAKLILRATVDVEQWRSEDDLFNEVKELVQVAGVIWDVSAFGISDKYAWTVLAERLVTGTNKILIFFVDMKMSSTSMVNKFPDRQQSEDQDPDKKKPKLVAQYSARFASPLVDLASYLYAKTLPVSHDFVKEMVTKQKCYFGAPSKSHTKFEHPLVRVISDMPQMTAAAWVASDAAKRGVFRALTGTEFARRQQDFVTAYIENHERKQTGSDQPKRPGLEALLNVDWSNNPEEWRTETYGNDVDVTNPAFNYTADHPLMIAGNISPVVTMADRLKGTNKIFYYLYWIDIVALESFNAKQIADILLGTEPSSKKRKVAEIEDAESSDTKRRITDGETDHENGAIQEQ